MHWIPSLTVEDDGFEDGRGWLFSSFFITSPPLKALKKTIFNKKGTLKWITKWNRKKNIPLRKWKLFSWSRMPLCCCSTLILVRINSRKSRALALDWGPNMRNQEIEMQKKEGIPQAGDGSRRLRSPWCIAGEYNSRGYSLQLSTKQIIKPLCRGYLRPVA